MNNKMIKIVLDGYRLVIKLYDGNISLSDVHIRNFWFFVTLVVNCDKLGKKKVFDVSFFQEKE